MYDWNKNADEVLLKYFQRLEREQPEIEEWGLGAAHTLTFLEMKARDDVTPEEVSELVRALRDRQHYGSGWLDLILRVEYWAANHNLLETAAATSDMVDGEGQEPGPTDDRRRSES